MWLSQVKSSKGIVMSSQKSKSQPQPGNDISVDSGIWETLEYEEVFNRYGLPPSEKDTQTMYLISVDYLAYLVRGIEGKVLTLIDASTEDKEKRESLKSLARQLVWDAIVSETRLLKVKKIKDK